MVQFTVGNREWGYLIGLGLVLVLVATVTPMISMGLIFGDFAQQNQKQATDLVVINVIVLSASHLIGIVATPLLNYYSTRVVALIGATLVILGNFLTISVNNFNELLIYYILQGLGLGILLPAHFAALQSYFCKRLTLVVSLIYVISTCFSIIYPTFLVFLLQNYGFRPTLAILAGITLITVPTSLILCNAKITKDEEQSLLNTPSPHRIEFLKLFNFKLFKNPIYLNISIGLSLGFTADYAFFTMAPLVLQQDNFTLKQIGLLLTIAFVGDLAMNAVLAVINGVVEVSRWNRRIFFLATVLAIPFRMVFIQKKELEWKMAALGLLGCTSSLTHTPVTLIISESFPENFSSAYSLYRVLCGCTTLLLGACLSLIAKSSDVVLVNLLNGANGLCVFCWMVEGVVKKLGII